MFEVSFENYLDFIGNIVNIYKSSSKNKVYKADARIYYENEDISEIW